MITDNSLILSHDVLWTFVFQQARIVAVLLLSMGLARALARGRLHRRLVLMVPLVAIPAIVASDHLRQALPKGSVPALTFEPLILWDAAQTPAAAQSGFILSIQAAALGAWVAGTLLLTLRLLVGYMRWLGVVNRAEISTTLTNEMRKLAEQSGSKMTPEVRISTEVRVPMTGYQPKNGMKSVVVVPSGFSAHDDAERRAVLLHELSHIRSHDVALIFLTHLLVAWQWLNPGLWLFRRQWFEELEYHADHNAVRLGASRQALARALLSTSESSRVSAWRSYAAASGAARRMHARIRTLVEPNRQSNRCITIAGLSLALLGPALACGSAVTRICAPTMSPAASSGWPSAEKRTSTDRSLYTG